MEDIPGEARHKAAEVVAVGIPEAGVHHMLAAAGEEHHMVVAAVGDTLAGEGRRTAAVEDILLVEEEHHIDPEEVHRNRVEADTAVVPDPEVEGPL